MTCPEDGTFSLPSPTAGIGIYSGCFTSPISWALGNTNPYDLTNWNYVYDTNESIVENLSSCDGNAAPCSGNPPNTDWYLGIISMKCDSSSTTPQSKYDNIPYTLVMGDASGSTCVGQGSQSHGYGCCCDILGTCTTFCDKYHHWYMRDWESTMNYWDQNNEGTGENGKVYCCTYPCEPSDVNDGTYPERTVKCPQTYWPGSPLCVDVMAYSPTTTQGYCSYITWPTDGIGYCDTYMASSDVCQISKNQVFTGALSQWIQDELEGGTVAPTENDPFLPKVITYAGDQPGVFDNFIEQACSSVTMDNLNGNPNLAKLCGCFLPDKEYLLPGIIPVECQIVCALNSQVGGVSRGEWNAQTQQFDTLVCNQTTCVMDDTTIDLINTNYGSINLSQLCAGCSSTAPGGTACTCLMNGTTISSVNSNIGGTVTVDQLCQGCSSFSDSSATTGTNISCTTGHPIVYGGDTGEGCNVDMVQEGFHELEGDISSNAHLYWIIGGLGILIVALFVWWAVVKSRNSQLKSLIR